jgi:DNA-binding HxlR family transcriptional regulator
VKRTDRRSDCPTNFAVELLGDSWSLLIIRDLMFKGKRTYAEFAASEEQISTSVLAARLRSLVMAGIIRRTGSGRTTRYFLTRKGADLLTVMVEMILWSAKHDPATAAPEDFVARARSDRNRLLSELEAQISAAHSL